MESDLCQEGDQTNHLLVDVSNRNFRPILESVLFQAVIYLKLFKDGVRPSDNLYMFEVSHHLTHRMIRAMLVSESTRSKMGYLSSLFKGQSYLSHDNFVARASSSDCSWLFSVEQIRKRMN